MLEQLINHFTNGNKSKFANLLGIKPQTINTWIARNGFDADLIYSKCEYVSGDWLLSGDGEMLKPSGVTQVSHGDNSPNLNGHALRVTNGDTAATKALAEALARAQEQTAKAQEQIDRLLSIIERMQTGNG